MVPNASPPPSQVKDSADLQEKDMTAISVPHDSHKRLRAPIDRLFARYSIMRIEARVVARTEGLHGRLGAYQGTGEVVNLTNALSSLTTDIISSVIFEEPSDYLGAADFNEEWYHTLKMGTLNVPLFKHMPMIIRYVFRTASSIPLYCKQRLGHTDTATTPQHCYQASYPASRHLCNQLDHLGRGKFQFPATLLAPGKAYPLDSSHS